MKRSFWMNLDALARQFTPFGTAVLATLLGVLPLNIPGLGAVSPLWPLIAVYFWSMSRPDLFPAAAAFLIGLLYDALGGAPIGVNAAVFVLAHAAVVGQRRFLHGKPFALAWVGFALILAGTLVLSWTLASAWNGAVLPVRATVYQYFVTLGCFPLLAFGLHGWQRLLLKHV